MVTFRGKVTRIFKVGAVRFELTTFWTRTRSLTPTIFYIGLIICKLLKLNC